MTFKFTKLAIPDVILIESKKFEDSRGFFSELYHIDKFAEGGIDKPIKQINLSKSSKGVLRGLHYQLNPFAQGKIVRVISGSIFDVAVDIRKNSQHYGKWVGVNLNSENLNMLYIPEGFAHGFEVLSETVEFEYLCTNVYSPQHDRGIRYDDPFLNISWTTKDPILSEKDLKHPFLKDAETNF
ncbi:MAG: dTDP-4-dehydrorhamnose 3,5-epimerase [Endomicrobia bacterium]|nr:dTDP-4-dehydrorhamnose 3,5-epimerase [Endomicrobiia bacterium]MCL2507328.1 dTDP-4-dehydrorhamnose 3,5-epimerase [Endomicrobiia bacterium]